MPHNLQVIPFHMSAASVVCFCVFVCVCVFVYLCEGVCGTRAGCILRPRYFHHVAPTQCLHPAQVIASYAKKRGGKMVRCFPLLFP